MNNLRNCRICNSESLTMVISLGNKKNTSIFPKYGESESMPVFPIELCLCLECGLLQLIQPNLFPILKFK